MRPGLLLLALAAAAPPDPDALARRGVGAARAGRQAEAAQLLAEAAALLPNHAGVRLELARSLARLGRTDEALGRMAEAAALGVGADVKALEEALGKVAQAAEFQALRRRFADNVAPLARGTVAFRLAERDLFPESVAYDYVERAFYVGSMYRRKIVKVDASGAARDFVAPAQDGLWTVLGLKVDASRRELLANACNLGRDPAMTPPEPATVGRGALFRYSLDSGRLLRRHDAPAVKGRLCFNDLDLTPAGDVYLSAGPNGVFRLDRAREVLELFDPVGGVFINGLALSADGRRLFLAAHTRGVVAMDVATRRWAPLPLPANATLNGIDGLYTYGRTLVAVQNGLTHGPERVLQAFLDAGGEAVACVATLDRNHPLFDVPTTGVIVGDALYYVATSQLDSFDDKGQPWPLARLKENVALKVGLRDRCQDPPAGAVDLESERQALLQLHALDRDAHFRADVERLQAHAPGEFVAVSRGRIDRVGAADARAFFAGYFKGVTYHEWDDLEPPVVQVSPDGRMAWTIVRTRVRRTQRDAAGQEKEAQFVYAGIMTYEKRGGRWVRVANVSTFE